MAVNSLWCNPYYHAVKWRNDRFDRGMAHTDSASVPVVSVGNISAGGTGKTPFVRWITKFYREHRIIPAVVSRGYGRSTKGALLVSDGTTISAPPEESGDELALHGLDGGIVVAAERRIEGCRIAVQQGAEACILDDGFQHRQLRRDADIVLIDRATLHGTLLPFGRLREPLDGLKRARVAAIHEHLSATEAAYLPLNPNSLVIRYTTEAFAPYLALEQNGRLSGEAIASVSGINPTLAVCGIAMPERFLAAAERAGMDIAAKLTFPDHARYDDRRIRAILDACKKKGIAQILTTEKDAVKLIRHYREFAAQSVKILVLPVRIVITAGHDEFVSVLRSLVQ